MAEHYAARLDLGSLLGAVENAPPVSAADVLARQLGEAVRATDVAFLIADFSGQALIRLGHQRNGAASRTQGQETAERVPLSDGAHGRVLATQRLEVTNGADGARVVAPVTNRGEAIGVLELHLPRSPDAQTLADVALAA